MTEKEKAKAYDKKIREAILNGLIDCRDAPDLGWSNFGGIHIDDCIDWLEKQGKQNLLSVNERAWLYLVSDVLTWKDGIGQYLDDPRVQELAKRLCMEYAQKLYNSSILSNSSNTGKNEQKSADKIEPRFKVGDWVVQNYNILKIRYVGNEYYCFETVDAYVDYMLVSEIDSLFHLWTIQDAKVGDVLEFGDHGRLIIGILSGINKTTGKVDVSCLLEDNKFKLGVFYNLDTVSPHPAIKEQRDLLFQKIKEAGYKWNTETKTLEKLFNMILQEKIQKKAEGYRKLAPVFLEGAKFALENQWISVEDDLPCNHEELLEGDSHTTKMLVRMRHDKYKICIMGNKEGSVETGWHWRSSDYKHITHWMPITKLPKE